MSTSGSGRSEVNNRCEIADSSMSSMRKGAPPRPTNATLRAAPHTHQATDTGAGAALCVSFQSSGAGAVSGLVLCVSLNSLRF